MMILVLALFLLHQTHTLPHESHYRIHEYISSTHHSPLLLLNSRCSAVNLENLSMLTNRYLIIWILS
ncbi:hypothetical protein XBFFL1_2440011 [Xenorhabdus bovienii str. feltiae Florida]|nr:hypothetical protein XBFFR1_1040011 [Xenorhabdus bovienii str. feltiae France]CDG93263.1 hypothetical protein XBFFL1_2440011 [Xenorhabdus bovienii str. feltiae Florida]